MPKARAFEILDDHHILKRVPAYQARKILLFIIWLCFGKARCLLLQKELFLAEVESVLRSFSLSLSLCPVVFPLSADANKSLRRQLRPIEHGDGEVEKKNSGKARQENAT